MTEQVTHERIAEIRERNEQIMKSPFLDTTGDDWFEFEIRDLLAALKAQQEERQRLDKRARALSLNDVLQTINDRSETITRLRLFEFLASVQIQLERAERQLSAQAQEVERVREALRSSQPWPAPELLRKLADAADHLLDVHDCDAPGWEGVRIAAGIARTVAANLDGVASRPIGADEEGSKT